MFGTISIGWRRSASRGSSPRWAWLGAVVCVPLLVLVGACSVHVGNGQPPVLVERNYQRGLDVHLADLSDTYPGMTRCMANRATSGPCPKSIAATLSALQRTADWLESTEVPVSYRKGNAEMLAALKVLMGDLRAFGTAVESGDRLEASRIALSFRADFEAEVKAATFYPESSGITLTTPDD